MSPSDPVGGISGGSRGREGMTPTARVTPGPGLMDREDADLIFEAVNACIRLNPDNPLSAAEGLEALVRAAYDREEGRGGRDDLKVALSRVTGR